MSIISTQPLTCDVMRTFRFFLGFLLLSASLRAQTVPAKRAATMTLGANLSYLDNYWNGTAAQHFGDHVKTVEVNKRQAMLTSMARQGLKTVRIPVCFSAWASLNAPYKWDFPQNLAAIDSLTNWALQEKMRVIIDFHHPEMNGTFPQALNPERIKWIWAQIATRYRNTDPDRVFLELWNEPHDVKLADWINTATGLIQTVRAIAPNHTLIVGAHDYNGIEALLQLPVFGDKNIIYTFHFYDPFVFTHQGAGWVNEMKDVRNVPFPAVGVPAIPGSAKGTWVENAIKNYEKDGTKAAIVRQLEKAKGWSVANNVPIFCGEFGSYNEFADEISRCNHAFTNFQALGMMDIPCTFWEWDGGFNLFKRGSTSILSDCTVEALNYYTLRQEALGLEKSSNVPMTILPNPVRDTFQIQAAETVENVEIVDFSGKTVLRQIPINNQVSVSNLPDGFYVVKAFGRRGELLNYQKLVKY